jgi:broad specificity phosphatase PhoE
VTSEPRSISYPRIYFIRHGETAWSLSGRHTGSSDIPLTENGVVQSRRLQPLLQSVSFAHVLISPRQRARQTCALAGLAHAAEIEPNLAEWDYGAYEGLSTSEIRKSAPDWNIFRDGCPGGETAAQVSARADCLIARLSGLGGDIALFSHGQFGCVLAARWIGLAVIDGQHFALDTASLSILGTKPGHPDVPVVTRWNMLPMLL